MLKGIKKLFGPLLDDLDCVTAVKEAMELQVEAYACDGAASRNQELFGPLLNDLDSVLRIRN